MGERQLRVYVAGAYADRKRVENAFAAIRDNPHMELVHDWLKIIDAAGADADQTDEDAYAYAMRDLEAASSADVFLFLVPPADVVGRGCWAEFGYVLGRRNAKGGPTVVSSGNLQTSIFTRLPADHYETDVEAFLRLQEWVDRFRDFGEADQ